MTVRIEASWMEALADVWEAVWWKELTDFVRAECAIHQVYPPGSRIFAAFDAVPFHEVRCVILGQDPYHGPGQAHGLCFSVPEGVPHPPSLRNILREWSLDTGGSYPDSGDLSSWASRGVLLLNTCLTVRRGQPLSHQGRGWEIFTDLVVARLAARERCLGFVLWGASARRRTDEIDAARHAVVTSAHPSPLSAHGGFFGSRPFSRINALLMQKGVAPIDWSLP